MFSRYFFAVRYPPHPREIPPGAADVAGPVTVQTTPLPPETAPVIQTLTDMVCRRLDDDDHTVWTVAEVQRYLEDGYRQMAWQTRCFWDQLYLENQPDGFSCTQAWEVGSESFSYGVANYTYADERRELDEAKRIGPGNHTSPFEATDGHLSDAGATAVGDAVVDLPATLTEIDRAVWDGQTIEAMLPQKAARLDARYETTTGPVYAYLWRHDGVRSFRHLRVPSAAAASYTINGTWGALRQSTDLDSETATGGWGIARRIPGHHPLHGDVWGLPRRPYKDGTATKVEYWREGMSLGVTGTTYELPERYALYLRDYALGQCLARSGPGQDLKLAGWYRERWARDLVRMTRRLHSLDSQRTGVIGETQQQSSGGPPRPRLPWQFGQALR